MWSVEDEIAARSATYLEKNLDDTNVCHREFRDKSGIHVEADAIAVGETKAVADEVRVLTWQGVSAMIEPHVHTHLAT